MLAKCAVVNTRITDFKSAVGTNESLIFLEHFYFMVFAFIPQGLPHLAGENKVQNNSIKLVLGSYSRFFTTNKDHRKGQKVVVQYWEVTRRARCMLLQKYIIYQATAFIPYE